MKATITDDGGEFIVRTPYSDNAKDALKAVDGRRWDGARKAWVYPATSASAAVLSDVMEYLGFEVEGDETFKRLIQQWDAGMRIIGGDHAPMPDCPTKPFAHQELGYRLVEARDGTFLAWDMGTGKSKTVVDAVSLLKLRRTLIACPTTVMLEWPGQFERHGDPNIRVVVLDGKRSVKLRAEKLESIFLHEDRPVVFVLNYEAAWRPPLGPTMTGPKKRQHIAEPGVILRCGAHGWDMVVADEVHKIKCPQSRVSKFFAVLGKRAKRRVGLTGTPIPNNPLDLWAQMRFVDPGLFGLSFVTFRSRYANMGGFQGKQVMGFRNIEVLNKKFFMVAHRVEKRDVLDLPPVMHETRTVDLCAKARALYDDMAASFVTAVGDGTITTSNALTELLRFQQITGGAVGTDEGDLIVIDDAKERALEEILSDLPASEPVVVFGRFTHDVQGARRVAEKIGRRAYEISGRVKELNEWRADEGGAVLAVQISSGGVGIDLTRAAYCVYWSLGFSLGEYEQSVARLDRHGQTRPVTYYHLLARKTVDQKVYGALRSKKKVVDAILDDVVAGGIEALHGGRMG